VDREKVRGYSIAGSDKEGGGLYDAFAGLVSVAV
jgi:hypothetical protein